MRHYTLSVSQLLQFAVLGFVCGCLLGCQSHHDQSYSAGPAAFPSAATQIEYPSVNVPPAPAAIDVAEPFTARHKEPEEYWTLTLEEAIQLALANNRVMNDLGARVVTAPASVSTVYDPAIQQTDPRFGSEAALSEFDAQFSTSLFFARDERSLNSFFFGGGTNSLKSNNANFQAEINKQAATGTSFAVRNLTDYDRNNSPTNLFSSAYNTVMEAEVRHPLLQGGGVAFNRIAGPNAPPGSYNGILIARINTDVALADFETAIRDHLDQVERSYWQLYFAYRNFDNQVAGRAAALETWRAVKNQLDAGTADGEREALARDQYYLTQSQVENALSGREGGVGVYSTERQLRLLLGVAASDGRLIRPADGPTTAETLFDWSESVHQAVTRRVEIRRQRWNIKRRELELLASRNSLLGRLDLVALYRWRGFGDDLFGNNSRPSGSAAEDLFGGDLQGWQMGLQYSTPIGNRIGHAAVRNAELHLARERAILQEQEYYIVNDLSNAFAELDRAYIVSRSNLNRGVAARQRLDAAVAKYEAGEELLEFVLEAQSRATEAVSEYYRSLTEYSLGIARIHYVRGTLLDYYGVQLTEGAWCGNAYRSAAKEARKYRQSELNYCFNDLCPVTSGPYPQMSLADSADLLKENPEQSPTPATDEPPSKEAVDVSILAPATAGRSVRSALLNPSPKRRLILGQPTAGKQPTRTTPWPVRNDGWAPSPTNSASALAAEPDESHSRNDTFDQIILGPIPDLSQWVKPSMVPTSPSSPLSSTESQ